MMKKLTILFAVVCWSAAAIAQMANAEMMNPPKVLVIIREVVKPGKSAAHEQWEAGWPRAFAKAEWGVHYIAASSMTGEGRVLFMTGYDSLAAWESDISAQEKNAALAAEQRMLSEKDGDYLTGSRTGVFTLMPELSYQPAVAVAGMRYLVITSLQLKPGHNDAFAEVRKMIRAAHEKASLADHYLVYSSSAGVPNNEYLIIVPVKSLAEQDQFPMVHGQAYKDALGEDNQKKMTEFARQSVESSETQIFAFSPKMSYPSKEWVNADPEFWTPKPSSAAKPMAKTGKRAVKK